jgi:hypothetical protein
VGDGGGGGRERKRSDDVTNCLTSSFCFSSVLVTLQGENAGEFWQEFVGREEDGGGGGDGGVVINCSVRGGEPPRWCVCVWGGVAV